MQGSQNAIDKEMLREIGNMVKHLTIDSDNETERFILKLHILLEGILEKIIRKTFPYPKATLECELTFSQKLAIVKSICYQDEIALVFKHIKIINQIRNELAHNLESRKYEQLIHTLDNTYTINNGFQLDEQSLELFKKRAYMLYGTLLGIEKQLVVNVKVKL
ncbi:hypothetical protein QTN94_14785 [Vibrio sp. M250220]|uniref:hypothetical protein n=1 Tax=Vibrio sp. M250220 TaxID=3020894 RepID=UPI002F3F86FD